jgi:hypothetical protein
LDILLANLPTIKAALLLAMILGAIGVTCAALASQVDTLIYGKIDLPSLKVMSERGEARTVRVTKERLDKQGWKEKQRVVVSLSGADPSKSVVAEIQTRRKVGAFDNDSCAASLAVLRELGVDDASEDNTLRIILKELPWYSPLGAAYRTIRDPDPNVRLTWMVTIISTVVSLAVSELYYQRGLLHEAEKPTLRTTIHEAEMHP